MQSWCAFLLLCVLISLATGGQAQSYAGQPAEQQPNSVMALAAELAHIASKLAISGGNTQGLGPRTYRRQQPAAVAKHRKAAAVQDISKGLVQSVPVNFKGHKITVVALSNE